MYQTAQALIACDEGENNRVVGVPATAGGSFVRFEKKYGNCTNNVVEFGKAVQLRDTQIIIRGDNCRLIIGDNASVSARITINGQGSRCEIGAKTTAERIGVTVHEGGLVSFGSDCLISYDVEVRNTDGHSILCLDTGKRINPARDTVIGNKVWIAAHTIIGKGVVVADGVIVGQGAVVTSSVAETNCVVAGNPARVIRSRVTWDRRLIDG